MKLWSIWQEGYVTMEHSEGAKFINTVEAETFKEACIKQFDNDPYFRTDNLTPTWWGCRLFDNEIDARKVFG